LICILRHEWHRVIKGEGKLVIKINKDWFIASRSQESNIWQLWRP
jgi:hypothetical protein